MAIKLKMKVVDLATNVKYRKYSMYCLKVIGNSFSQNWWKSSF